VPGDVAVVGFDDIAAAAHFIPPLTTVQQDTHRAADMLVDNLLKMTSGEPVESALIEPKLVIRGSCRFSRRVRRRQRRNPALDYKTRGILTMAHHAFPNGEALARNLADDVAAALERRLARHGAAGLVVSGGRTPAAFLRELGSRESTGPTSCDAGR
jgi:hypothetical protein